MHEEGAVGDVLHLDARELARLRPRPRAMWSASRASTVTSRTFTPGSDAHEVDRLERGSRVRDHARELGERSGPVVQTDPKRGAERCGQVAHAADAVRRAASSWTPSQRSTAVAQRRPSEIAQTINDWPRRASPAAKTPSALVAYTGAKAFPRASVLDAELPRGCAAPARRSPSRGARGRPGDPLRCRGRSRTAARPSSRVQWIRSTRPSLPESAVVEMAKSRSPPSFSAYEVRSLHRPGRPGRQIVGPAGRGLADELDLRHRGGALAVCVRDAVGAGVAAADHDHVLARPP